MGTAAMGIARALVGMAAASVAVVGVFAVCTAAVGVAAGRVWVATGGNLPKYPTLAPVTGSCTTCANSVQPNAHLQKQPHCATKDNCLCHLCNRSIKPCRRGATVA